MEKGTSTVGHSYIPCTRENEAGKSQVQDQPEIHKVQDQYGQ